ncbi:hypothetical protein ACFV9E_39680 [Streptomyces sp. NPDC059835]|uniref:hypothetical protein n=1 Tax=Streptomyces sp. NPDC059835 TaxID=3346967 RepID=UPI00365893DE
MAPGPELIRGERHGQRQPIGAAPAPSPTALKITLAARLRLRGLPDMVGGHPRPGHRHGPEPPLAPATLLVVDETTVTAFFTPAVGATRVAP